MPGSWDDSHYLPEGADSFEPTQQHRRERFEHLYAQSQHSYRWFQWLQREADGLFRQVAFLSPTDINADPWKAQVRVLLQQVRELLHSKICCHMHQEKNIVVTSSVGRAKEKSKEQERSVEQREDGENLTE